MLDGVTDAPAPVDDDFVAATDPVALFRAWFAEASAAEVNDPDAMTLATVDEDGLPDARIVLLKGFDERGFVFYTNTLSAKGRELAAQPRAAIVLHWKSLRRQVRARGPVETVSAAEADAYFASRPRDSRLGAWASEQSQPMDARATFEARFAEAAARYEGADVPRPEHWSGYRLTPRFIEFWHDRPFRLHDRVRFSAEPEGWSGQRLYP